MIVEKLDRERLLFAAKPPEMVVGLMTRAAVYLTAKGPLAIRKERARRLAEKGVSYTMATQEDGRVILAFRATRHLKWPEDVRRELAGRGLVPDRYMAERVTSLVYIWARQIWADPSVNYLGIATATTEVVDGGGVAATVKLTAQIPEILDPFLLQLKRDLRPWLGGEVVILPLEYEPEIGSSWTILAPANSPNPRRLLETSLTSFCDFLNQAFGDCDFMVACDKACRKDAVENAASD